MPGAPDFRMPYRPITLIKTSHAHAHPFTMGSSPCIRLRPFVMDKDQHPLDLE